MKRIALPLAALLIVSCQNDIDDNGTAGNNNGENPEEAYIDYRFIIEKYKKNWKQMYLID